MTFLPRQGVHFFPFFEGATLYRQATLQLSVLNQNKAIIRSLLKDVGTPDGVYAALQRKFTLYKDRAAGGVRETVKFFLIMFFCIKKSIEEKPEEIFEDRIVSGLPEVANRYSYPT